MLLALGETLVWAGLFYSFAALFLAWERDLGWSKTDLTLGVTLAILTSALCAPVAGRIIDAGYGRQLMSLGAVFGAVMLASLALVTSKPMFLSVWVLIGAAQSSCLYESCFSFVTRTLGGAARFAITRITLFAGFASTLSFPAAAVLSQNLGWRATVVIFAIVVALVAAPLLYTGAQLLERHSAEPPVKGARSDNQAAVKRAMARREFWLLALAFSLVAMNHGTILNHILPIFVDRGASLWMATAAASLVGPAQVLGRVMMLRFEVNMASVTLALIALATACVAAMVLLTAELAPALIFPFAVLQGCAFGVFSILRPVMVAEILGRAAFASISARTSVPYLIAVALSPVLGALLWQIAGYDLVIAAALGFSLLALLAIRLLRPAKLV